MPVLSNKKIDLSLLNSTWEIEPDWGQAQLQKYLHELELLNQGATFADLQYSERRKQNLPTFLNYNKSDEDPEGAEQSIQPGSIAVLQLQGVMRLEDGLSSRGIKSLIRDLQEADTNPNVDAIVIEVNSGGGEALAGSALQSAIKDTQKPVIGLVYLMASAAVKAMLPATKIYAVSESSQIGSIGTMMTVDRELLEYYRENFEDIYAEQAKGKNSEFRALLAGDKGPIIEKLNQVNQIFVDQVQKYRDLEPVQTTEKLLQGYLVLAGEAIEAGLIDGLASFKEVINEAVELSNKEEPTGFSNNSNFQQMSKPNFITRLLPFLAAKANVQLEEGANEEDILQALEQAPDFSQAAQEAAQEAATEMIAAAIQETEKKLALQIENVTKKLEEATEDLQEQAAKILNLEAALAGKKVASQEGGQQEANHTPAINTFEATRAWRKGKELGIESKY